MQKPEDGFSLSIDALKTGDADTAALLAKAVVEQHPATPWGRRALYLSAKILLARDRPAEAEDVIGRISREYPELSDYALFALAEYYAAKTRYPEAVSACDRLLASSPGSLLAPRAMLRRAQALAASGRHQDAAAAFEQLLNGYPRSEHAAEAGLGLGRASAELRDFPRASRAYLAVSVRYPNAANDAEVEKALSGLKLLGAGVPVLTADEYYERGRNLFRTGQHDKAYEAFARALSADPSHSQKADILLRSGIALFHLGRRSEAASLLDRLVKERPPDCRCAEAYHWLGKSYSRTGLREEAVRAYLKVVTSYPESEWADDALYLIGNVYRDANDRTRANAFYRRLANEYPESSLADSGLWWQAWTAYQAGEYRTALQTLRELSSRYPRSFLANQARYWQGRAWEKLGETQKALASYREVLTRGPYTYYGYRSADRLMTADLPVVMAAEDLPAETAAPEEAPDEETIDTSADTGGPPIWTEEAVRTLSSNPAYRKILELMYLGMKKEAAAELGTLQERIPARHGSLVGLSKTYFELGDYHRSLMIVLRNFERLLERPSDRLPDDVWLLAFPQGYWDSIVRHANRYGLDPYFVAAIIREESQFLPEAVSPAGARGVMQVMPATGEWIARLAGIADFDRARLLEPDMNVGIGAWYVNHLMKKFKGDVMLVAAAYNAGPEPVLSWVERTGTGEPDVFAESIPFAETRGYVKKVLRNYAEYRRVYGRGPGTSSLSLPGLPSRAAAPDINELLCRAAGKCP